MEIKDTLRENLERLRKLGYFDSNLSLAKRAGVSSATINSLTLADHSAHPKINKLDQIASALKVPAWSLLISNFPFEQYQKTPNLTICKEAIEITQIINNLSNQDIQAILDYARYIANK